MHALFKSPLVYSNSFVHTYVAQLLSTLTTYVYVSVRVLWKKYTTYVNICTCICVCVTECTKTHENVTAEWKWRCHVSKCFPLKGFCIVRTETRLTFKWSLIFILIPVERWLLHDNGFVLCDVSYSLSLSKIYSHPAFPVPVQTHVIHHM